MFIIQSNEKFPKRVQFQGLYSIDLQRFITFLQIIPAIIAKSLVGNFKTSNDGHCIISWVTDLNVICKYVPGFLMKVYI
jgi:hypothetical protein